MQLNSWLHQGIPGFQDSLPELAVAARTHCALELDDAAQTHGASKLDEGAWQMQRGTVATSEPTRTRRPKNVDVAAQTHDASELDEATRRMKRGANTTIATSEPTRTRRPKNLDVVTRPHCALEMDDAAQMHGASELDEATWQTKTGANTAIAASEPTRTRRQKNLDAVTRPHCALEMDDAAQMHGASELNEATWRTKRGVNTAIATSEATREPEHYKLDRLKRS